MTELVSKKWAKALIELSSEDESLSKENILSEIRDIGETINSSEELSNVINNPSISTEEKRKVIDKLFHGKVMPIVFNFIYVLNMKKRLNLICDIADEFENKLDELNNIVRVNITSAIDINDKKKEDIKSRVSEKLQKDVKVSWDTNSDIIAGLIFNINGTVVDNSIKNKLEKLSEIIIKR